jgi:hypothetical protein
MRFRITGQGWRLGADALVPADTIIDFAKSDQWSKRAKGKPIPLTATPLDEEAFLEQVRLYPDHKHLLRGGWI